MLAFRVRIAGDVNQQVLFVATVLSNTFTRALLGLIHWSPRCHLQLSIFQIYAIEYFQNKTLNFFEAMGLHRTLDFNCNPMDSSIRE